MLNVRYTELSRIGDRQSDGSVYKCQPQQPQISISYTFSDDVFVSADFLVPLFAVDKGLYCVTFHLGKRLISRCLQA